MIKNTTHGKRPSGNRNDADSKDNNATRTHYSLERKSPDSVVLIKDSEITSPRKTRVSTVSKKEKKGMATVENTLNSMTGDISYEDLIKIPGISLMATKAKESVGEVSIFQRKDYISSLKSSGMSDISYHNIPLISQFVATSARIVPIRISYVEAKSQKLIARSIKIARFLGLLKYVDY